MHKKMLCGLNVCFERNVQETKLEETNRERSEDKVKETSGTLISRAACM